MVYVFLSSVCITLFLVLGGCALYGLQRASSKALLGGADTVFLPLSGERSGVSKLMQAKFPLGWTCYQHVIVLVLLAVLCFIAAVLFGTQIPDCYVS